MVLKGQAEPKARRLSSTTVRMRRLGEVLRANPNGVLAHRDELIGLLKSLDREGHEGARSFFLSAWAGKEAHTFDRIGRGLNLRIEACCLSLLGQHSAGRDRGIPPGCGRQRRGGWAAGSLPASSLAGHRWRALERMSIDGPTRRRRATRSRRSAYLNELTAGRVGASIEEGADSVPASGSVGAGHVQRLARDGSSGGSAKGRGDHSAVIAHLAKYRKLVPTLALDHACRRTEAGPDRGSSPASRRSPGRNIWSPTPGEPTRALPRPTDGAKALLGRIRSGAL